METKTYKTVLLPTDSLTTIKRTDEGELFNYCGYATNGKFQHLYFVSDEEIAMEDYLIVENGKTSIVGKVIELFESTVYLELGWSTRQLKVKCDCKKIIASTDDSLNLPNIPQSYVEYFVKNNGGVPDVELEVETYGICCTPDFNHGIRHQGDCDKCSLYKETTKLILNPNNEVIPVQLEHITANMERNIVETIKSQTNCPTCGSEVTVGGHGDTHYYIPTAKQDIIGLQMQVDGLTKKLEKSYSRQEVEQLFNKIWYQEFGSKDEQNDWIKQNLTK